MAPMEPVVASVKNLFAAALKKAFPAVSQEVIVVKGNPKFADYQCNNAMALYKEVGQTMGFKSPAAVAEAISKNMPPNELGKVSVAGGFVNFKLSDDYLEKQVASIVHGEIEYSDSPLKRVVVDFSSPNIAKDMHVGHLRSTIIGETMCRILEFSGHEVHRINHVGDWGTQFGMLIEYMREEFPNFLEDPPAINDLQEFYKAAKRRFDENEEFKEKARLRVVDLQSGGEFSLSAWKAICDISRKTFESIYSRLDIKVQERGESYYNEMIAPLVEELKSRGFVKESDGAMCMFTPRVSDIPLMAVKSDGGFGYDSTDLAAIYHRLFVMRADWLIYITDLGQEQHFHMIFDAAEQCGWHKPPITRTSHMGFGVIQGADGKKFKTRSGETVKLKDLLDEAVERAHEAIMTRVNEQREKKASGDDYAEVFLDTEAEQKNAAEQIGISAVRYFDMKQNRTTNYRFEYDKMLDPKGNTSLYLFFLYARLNAIQRKSGVDVESIEATKFAITDPAERELALKLLQFPDVIDAMIKNIHLHQLTDYLWETSNLATSFITKCRVIGSEEMMGRLALIEATRKVLRKAFYLMGMKPLERM